MKKNIYFYFVILLIFIFTPYSYAELHKNYEIIGTVNGENLYLGEFNRLLNAQKRKHNKDILENKEKEKKLKEKLIDQMINELLALQEAKKRNIQISEEEIISKLNLLLQKQGDESNFIQFLAENNATIEDTKNEIKNQILYERVKNEIPDFNSFIEQKKSEAGIVIYNSKIFPEENNTAKEQITEIPAIRTKEYPTFTKAKLDEIKKLEEKTNVFLKEQIKQKVEETKYKEIVIKPIELKTENQTTNTSPQPQSSHYSADLNSLNIFKKSNSNLQNTQLSTDKSKEIEELRRKIEQRRISVK